MLKTVPDGCKRRCGIVDRMVHWKLCEKVNLDIQKLSYVADNDVV